MADTNILLFFVGFLLFLSVVASALSRFGPPLLLIFLVVGMLAGEDGPGQVSFDSVPLAFFIANLALAVILLDGGLRTHLRTFRVALWPAMSLATVGVLVSATLAGAFIALWLDIDWRYGLLLGSIVASTDAAAVFAQLRNSGVTLNERVSATLEIESGTNDPMAIFLVTFVLSAISTDESFTVGSMLSDITRQFGIGLIGGLAFGYGLSFLASRMPLVEGLYALLVASGGLMAFAAINQLGGSGFLGIYLVGVIVGNRRSQASEHVSRVMDGLAWLAQAGMFLVLGLLVNPQQLWAQAAAAVLIALFLIFVARPVAVWLSLLPFNFPSREQGFIAWVGLRGAVPIVLALFPMMAEMPGGAFIFNITFTVVLVSLLVQGSSIGFMARWLKLQVPRKPGPDIRFDFDGWRSDRYTLLGYRIRRASSLAATRGEALRRLSGLRCIAVTRKGRLLFPKPQFVFAAGDLLYLVTPLRHREELDALFRGSKPKTPEARTFFGQFTLRGDANASDVAAAYGVRLDASESDRSLTSFVRRRLKRRPVVGDVVDVGGLRLTVRTLDAGAIDTVGLSVASSKARATAASNSESKTPRH